MRAKAIERVNPVTKFAVSFLIAGGLVASVDWVSAGVALVLELALLPFAGVRFTTFWRRTAPLWIAAPLSGVTILLYGQPSGDTHLQVWLIHVTDGSIVLAFATMLRVLAIALPAVVLFITIDPTDFADGLAQVAKLPARFVVGALAGVRLIGLFLEDWHSLELARRARGVGDRNRIRRFAGLAFALFVLSIRRGSTLATAMEARGFGGTATRTWARESRLHAADAVMTLIAFVIVAAAITLSVITGHWNPIGAQ
jgi:energy-coupling factor transport system permease protein